MSWQVYASGFLAMREGGYLLTNSALENYQDISAMENFVTGLWGFFYGFSFLVLCGAVFVYFQSMRRIGLNAGMSAVGPAFGVTAFMGGLPIDDRDTLLRMLAHLTALVGPLLFYQLLNVLGALQTVKHRRLGKSLLLLLGGASVGVSWALAPPAALVLCGAMVLLLALLAFAISIGKALGGDRRAWIEVVAVMVVAVAYSCLLFGVLHPEQWTWQIQALTAAASSVYVLALASMNCMRYAYLLERKKAMEYGPAYDPVTRLRSHSETGQMARDIFNNPATQAEPLGVIVLTISNLYALEKLHGIAAVNSALFLIAGRLKRNLPARVEIGRLGFDAFLLIMRNCTDSGRLVRLAQDLNQRLHKAATINTNPDAQQLETAHTVWQAQIGIGVLHVKNLETSSLDAITMGRNMSRTAVSYASKVAWFDHASGEMTELPAHPGMV